MEEEMDKLGVSLLFYYYFFTSLPNFVGGYYANIAMEYVLKLL